MFRVGKKHEEWIDQKPRKHLQTFLRSYVDITAHEREYTLSATTFSSESSTLSAAAQAQAQAATSTFFLFIVCIHPKPANPKS